MTRRRAPWSTCVRPWHPSRAAALLPDDLHAPILGSTFFGAVVVDRLIGPEAARAQACRRDIRRDERVDHGGFPRLRQFDVVIMLADVIRVPVNGERQPRIIRHELHHLGDDWLGVGP